MRARIFACIPIIALSMLPALAGDPISAALPCSANDAGGTPATATTINTPAACTSDIDGSEADYYKFQVSPDQTIAVNFSHDPNMISAVRLYDPLGADRSDACNPSKQCTVQDAVVGSWIAGISYVSGSQPTSYALVVALAAGTPAPLCETDGDAPDSSGTSKPISPPLACSGTIDAAGDTDWFTFKAKVGSAISAAVVRQSGGPFSLMLIGPNGVRACTNDAASLCSVTSAEAGPGASPCATAASDWCVGVKGRAATSVGDYVFALSVAEQIDPVPYTCEPQDAKAVKDDTATNLQSPAACTGRLESATDSDVYRFEVGGQAGGVAAAAVTVAPLNGSTYSVVLTDPAGRTVACTAERAVACAVAQAAPGRYYLAISRGAGVAGAYAIGVVVAIGEIPQRPVEVPSTCESTGDAGGTTATAKDVTHPGVCVGRLESNADVDVYKFVVTAASGDTVAASVVVAPMNNATFPVTVTSPNGAAVNCTSDRVTACAQTGAAAGTWYVAISRGASSPDQYALGVAVANANPGSVGDTVGGAVGGVIAAAMTPCESTDAGSTAATAAPLPWTSQTETATMCRGSVAGTTDTVDVYKFLVRSDNATVRVMLQPESVSVDLTLSLTPPPGACDPTTHVNGQCPTVTSQLGKNGQPDFVDQAVGSPYSAKSGEWIITVGRAPDSTGGFYELGVHVAASAT